jgi:Na+/melibiose symporter-like transporter
VAPPEGATVFTQSESTLWMIRLMVSPISTLILAGAILSAWLYPLTREKYQRIQKLLEKKKASPDD